jgi:hypothetical protein
MMGFERDRPEVLGQALIEHVQTHHATEVATEFEKRYIVDAPLRTPSGRTPLVRSIWEVKDGSPRLVTAYPRQVRL